MNVYKNFNSDKTGLYKNKYRIESSRLKGWDYASDGYYFITICTKNREYLFGTIVDKKMILSEYGQVVHDCWFDLINHYKNIRLDEFIIMPNHIHGIMAIDNGNVETGNVETGLKPVSTHGLFEFIRALKTFSARKINKLPL